MPLDRPDFYDSDIALYNADCRELLPGLPGESVDMVLTDPPYLVSYRGRWGSAQEEIVGDSDSTWVEPVFRELWRVLKPDAFCLTFYGWPHADLFLSVWKRIGFRPVSHLVCIKSRIGFGQFSRSQHETAYLLAKGNPERPAHAMSDVFTTEHSGPLLHPNQKPLNAITRMLSTYMKDGDLVLDPFSGSGTTLVAARNLGCSAIGIEIEPTHHETAVLRLSQERLPLLRTSCKMPEQIQLHLISSIIE